MTAPAVTHGITVEEIRATRWRSVCSCGKYTSAGYSNPKSAEESGLSHIRSSTRAVKR